MARDEEPKPAANIEATPEAPEDPGEELLEFILAEHEARTTDALALPSRIDGVMIGRIIAVDADGCVRVDYPGCRLPESMPARVMTAITETDVGRDVALLFEAGDPEKPVVMGLMFQGAAAPAHPPVFSRTKTQATVDGERIVFSAEREIVLECGQASITLTRAGKILIRGAYVSTRSSGVNRIQGGSVQIN